jgi:hypothetical protein
VNKEQIAAMDENTFAGSRAFARYMLRDNRLLIRPRLDSIHVFNNYAIEVVLFRESCWQVELITMLPGAVVPIHRHNRVDSCDLMLAGDIDGVVVGGVSVNHFRRGPLPANLVRVGKGIWHGGSPADHGAVYLSFQKWDGPPGVISDDWEQP